jgi:ElaB/YqjD/DUF883 family membrane-anchored ribosome-binding protein
MTMPDETSTTGAKAKRATAKTKAKVAEAKVAVAEAVESAKDKSSDWKAQADDFTKQAKGAARTAATSAKNTTGDALHGLSKLITETAETVDFKLGPQYGDYARKAAEAVAGAAKSLDEKDIDQLTEDARNFVRKSPAVTIGAAAVVGFVLMRMMRSGSSSDES